MILNCNISKHQFWVCLWMKNHCMICDVSHDVWNLVYYYFHSNLFLCSKVTNFVKVSFNRKFLMVEMSHLFIINSYHCKLYSEIDSWICLIWNQIMNLICLIVVFGCEIFFCGSNWCLFVCQGCFAFYLFRFPHQQKTIFYELFSIWGYSTVIFIIWLSFLGFLVRL